MFFGNDILTAGSEYSIRSFLYSRVNPLTEKKEILLGGMRNCFLCKLETICWLSYLKFEQNILGFCDSVP